MLSTACFAFCWFWVVVCFALRSPPVLVACGHIVVGVVVLLRKG